MEAGSDASRWAPVLAYTALSAANQMLWLTFTPITSGAARHYGVSSSAIGWLAELFPLVYVVLALPAGRLVDRAMPLWLSVGAVLTAAGALLRLAGHDYLPVLLGQVLVAVAQPLVLNAVIAVSARYLRAADRQSGIAVSSAGIFAGMVLALLLGALAGDDHVRALLIVQAVLAVLAAAPVVALLAAAVRERVAVSATAAVRTVWALPAIRPLVGLVCAGFGVFIALTTWLQVLLEPAGVSDTASGYLLLVMVVAGVLGSALLPQVIARRGLELRFIGLSVVAAVAALVLLAAAPGLVSAAIASVVIGAALLTDLPVILELVQRAAGDAGGTAGGLVWLAGNGAGLLAAVIVQTVRHHPPVAFGVLAVLLVAGAPLLVVLGRRSLHAQVEAGLPAR